MRFLGHLIVRLVAIVFGLMLAFLGAGIFLGFGFYREIVDPALQAEPSADGLMVVVLGLFWSPLVAGAALGPAAILIALAEGLRLRGLTVNLVLGGLAALLSFWLAVDAAPHATLSGGALVVLLATGFIGVFLYWLVAGRNAGRWLEAPSV